MNRKEKTKSKILFAIFLLLVASGCQKKQEEKSVREKSEIATPAIKTTQEITKEPLPVKTTTEKEIKKAAKITPIQPQEIVYPPKVKCLSYTVEDSNKNGKIDLGEKIKLKVTVQNIGKGEGKELTAKVDTEGKLNADEDEISIWPVGVNQTKQFSVGVTVPSLTPENVTVHLTFSEGTKVDIPLTVAVRPKTEQEKKAEQKVRQLDKKREDALKELEESK